ncbi:hypothetical protein AG1IA_06807 [Rhizoctonia solani AG-1 IA]|uniref:Uncharacterized protein n=1 Tax=Thanatephorus cucumeris (strain AG1-IA) TaxID=983506 RepID=L8WQY4_THACA|nr:hypothetical protein AG1IA_06807 [Rhizoctonia solani AG-1 IA]
MQDNTVPQYTGDMIPADQVILIEHRFMTRHDILARICAGSATYKGRGGILGLSSIASDCLQRNETTYVFRALKLMGINLEPPEPTAKDSGLFLGGSNIEPRGRRGPADRLIAAAYSTLFLFPRLLYQRWQGEKSKNTPLNLAHRVSLTIYGIFKGYYTQVHVSGGAVYHCRGSGLENPP